MLRECGRTWRRRRNQSGVHSGDNGIHSVRAIW
jgi:hypothetical protein